MSDLFNKLAMRRKGEVSLCVCVCVCVCVYMYTSHTYENSMGGNGSHQS